MSSAESQKPLDVAIVGGGIGGVALATGLMKYGIKVSIYEAAHHFGEIGAGVAFGPNATHAMAMIDPKLKAAFDHVKTNNQWESMKNVWFNIHDGRSENLDLVASIETPEGQATTHRADFLNEMIKIVPEGIAQFGKRLVEIENTPDERVRLRFLDGTMARHDIVVGCDGIKSEVRKYVVGYDSPSVHPRYSGSFVYRAIAPMEKAVELLGDRIAKNNNMFLNKGKIVLTYPVQKGKTFNMVVGVKDPVWNHDEWVIHTTIEKFKKDLEGFSTTLQNVGDLVDSLDIWAIFDTFQHPLTTYHKGRVAVMGDAAHATSPYQGSGAGMALEDAYVLSSLLGSAKDVTQAQAAMTAFDTLRRPRTQNVCHSSRLALDMWSLDLEGYEDNLDKMKPHVEKMMEWVWGESLEWEIRKGRNMIGL